MVGGWLVVARPGGHRESTYLVDLIQAEQISTLHFVPSMLEIFLEERGAGECRNLKRVICSGEALSSELRRKYYRKLEAGLHNLYGPTEAAVDVTSYACGEEDHGTATVPIGKPISNLQMYVLDEDMELAPAGGAGELYIGGIGVGRGYLNRPDLTAERFIPNPIARSNSAAGERLYRTGDQARWLGDGNLEFLGRLDQKVKIRGFRIELGEIEAALQEQAEVRQAVVIARDDEPGDKRLVAYVVPANPATELKSSELREQLTRRLPEYMVPRAIVRMEELPLTPNGKLDRKRLPKPEQQAATTYQAPRKVEEEILCGIWEQMLKLERVGVGENFFDLGGHSLLATQVISRVREAFAVELPLRVLFEKPTVAGMVESLEQARRSSSHSGEEQIRALMRLENRAELPLSYAQQRLWFLEQMDPGNAVYNIPFALRMTGELDREALRKSFAEIVRRHEALRTVFVLNDRQEPVQRVLDLEEIGFRVEEIEAGHAGGEERRAEARRIAQAEAGQGFDLTRGPLMRVKLLSLGEQE